MRPASYVLRDDRIADRRMNCYDNVHKTRHKCKFMANDYINVLVSWSAATINF